MSQLSLTRLVLIGAFPVVLLLGGCGQEPQVNPLDNTGLVKNNSADVQVAWNNLYLSVDRYAQNYRPAPSARALAYFGLAAYESCISGMPEYQSMIDQFPGLAIPAPDPEIKYYWPAVVHGVYSEMMSRFFPETQSDIRAQWNALLSEYNSKLSAEAGQSIFNSSVTYGRSVGEAVWNWSATDEYGYNADLDPYGDYLWQDHYTKPGDWIPTFPGPGKALFPNTGKFRTFAILPADKIAYPPSVYYMEYSTNTLSEYYAQAIQTYTKNAATDYGTEWIGEFWSDDLVNLTFSPAARWVAIASQVVVKENANLQSSLEAYAKVGVALNDAIVACWHSKYLYNVERPVTYIQTYIDPNYKTNLNNPLTGDTGITPSFPSYPSGHATMAAASAEALASVFGYAYDMTDRCHQGRTQFEGTPRTFGSFYEMAQECAWSRVLLGVHWRMDADEGVRMGTNIGRKVNKLPWKN